MLSCVVCSMKIRVIVVAGLILLALTGCRKETGTPVTPVVSAPFELTATADIAMYEVNLRAFSTAGNLNGLLARLDSIRALSINVIWLMPVYPVGQLRSVGGLGSPYSIRDYKAIAAEYGTMADMQLLITEAHKRGIAILLDWVANHTAWDHAWITTHPDWYTQDGSGTIIHPPGTTWLDVADLNFSNAEMRLAMIQEIRFWTETMGVDGFRCDAADMVPYDFWKQAIDSLRQNSPKRLLMLAEGARSNHFAAGFDLNFGWDFYTGLKLVFENDGGTANLLSRHHSEYLTTPEGKHRLRFSTNHDEYAWDNSPVTLFNGIQGSFSAFAMAALIGGVPLIYNGQEVGIPQKIPFFTKQPINWSLNPGLSEQYKKLMQIRTAQEALRKGGLFVLSHTPVTAFYKYYEGDTVLICIGNQSGSQNLSIPDYWQDANWEDLFTGQPAALGNGEVLNGYEVKIYSRKP